MTVEDRRLADVALLPRALGDLGDGGAEPRRLRLLERARAKEVRERLVLLQVGLAQVDVDDLEEEA